MDRHGLVQQNLTVDTVALGTLQPRAALIINTQFSTPLQTFLAKRVRYFLQLEGRTDSDDGPLLVGCCHGDASVSEIAASMTERNVNGEEDITSMLDQDLAWVVYQTTVQDFRHEAVVTRAQLKSHWIKFPGKNGTPLIEGSGMTIFVFNAGSAALSTASTINGVAYVQGVWMND